MTTAVTYSTKQLYVDTKIFQPHENIKITVVYLKCKDKYLVQKCSKEKGGQFAITGGHLSVENTSQTPAVIEVQKNWGFVLTSKN